MSTLVSADPLGFHFDERERWGYPETIPSVWDVPYVSLDWTHCFRMDHCLRLAYAGLRGEDIPADAAAGLVVVRDMIRSEILTEGFPNG